MQKLADFFKLIRWPNLVFIALTQLLFFYCVVQPVLFGNLYMTREYDQLFVILCLSSVFIAAAGYVINDYFDLNIDLVNKPGRRAQWRRQDHHIAHGGRAAPTRCGRHFDLRHRCPARSCRGQAHCRMGVG